ncbi:TonB-dependent receptor, partial [Steroidobacter sp.]|uniref:TonB-dependent receptor n=1 Tax=Steroidobacter sp. TaxID=1978227 RepID=UPI001A635A8D
ITHNLAIPTQPLSEALKALSIAANEQILFSQQLVEGKQSPEISGAYTTEQALGLLLAGSGLQANRTPSGVLLIRAAPAERSSSAADKTENDVLYEIVVTAQKRSESIQDVPMSISAYGQDAMEKRNLVDMNDFLRTMPGVNFIDYGAGRNTIIVRGVTADPQLEGKVVGTYFGETPITGLGSSAGGGNGSSDLKMVDIERVELLRGPQGTLYGSGSLGGTLRIIPNKPDLATLGGNVEIGFSNTSRLGGANQSLKGDLNVPVVQDVFAVRMVGYQFNDSGYIDNVAASNADKAAAAAAAGAIVFDERHRGETDTTGARFSALWQLSEDFSANLSYTYQKTHVDGRTEVNLNLGDYQQVRFQSPGFGEESMDDELRIANLELNYDFGWGSLRSSTSSVKQRSDTVRNFLGTFFETTPVGHLVPAEYEVFSEELRFVSQFQGPLHIVGGVFFQDTDAESSNLLYWLGAADRNPFDPTPTNFLGSQTAFNQVQQKAVFSEVGYDIVEQLTLTLGARYYDYDVDQRTDNSEVGALTAGVPDVRLRSNESGTNFKANLTYRASDDAMIYLQWAQGFRLGSPTSPFPSTCDLNGDGIHDELGLRNSTRIKSDSLDSYELGSKIMGLTRRLSLNTSVYHTKWEGIPVFLGIQAACGFGLTVNAGSAETSGAEVEGSYLLHPALRADFSASYTEAKLTSAVPALGPKGARLPGSPKVNASLGLQYDYQLGERESYTRLDWAYVGGFYGQINSQGLEGGDYSQVNIKSGIEFERFNVSVYVNNLTNSKALAWVDVFEPNAVRLRPRTVGINLGANF